MKSLDEIRTDLRAGRLELTAHALKRAVQRNISASELAEIAETVEVIEEYPDDKYFPSSLLLGFTQKGRPLHLHVSRMSGARVRLITIYEPNANQWVEHRKRK